MRHERRILVVDDDNAIRALLFTVLRRRGMSVDTARNGIEAMEKLAGNSYAMMLLDLMMPQMSGYEVLENLAALPTRPLVLVLTAGMESRPIDTTLVVGTIHKPFDVELLVETIIACMKTLEASQTIPPDAPQRTDEVN